MRGIIAAAATGDNAELICSCTLDWGHTFLIISLIQKHLIALNQA